MLEIDGQADVTQAVSTFQSGAETIVVGVSLDHYQTPEAIEGAVRDILAQNLEASLESAYTAHENRQLAEFEDIADQASELPIQFERLDVRDPSRVPEALGGHIVELPAPGSVRASDAALADPPLLRGRASNSTTGTSTQATQLAAVTKWSPNWFNISAGSYNGGTRWGRLLFAWDYGRMYNLHWGFNGANITFEPDFKTNNYDGFHYFSNKLNAMYAWTSNMPCAYLDTRLSDKSTEQIYTIGCYDARQLNPNVKYFTYFQTAPGNTAADKAKAAAQPSHRVESLCRRLGYALCVFSYDVDPSFYPKQGQWTGIPTSEVRFFATDL